MTNGRLNAFQNQIRNTIMVRLENGAASIADLAKETGFNYYSVRNVVRIMEDEGTIKSLRGSYRNAKYVLGTDDGPNNIIPSVRTKAGVFKLQDVMDLRKQESPTGIQSITNLPQHVARILHAAIRIKEGRTDALLSLNALRLEMESDVKSLQSVLNVYDQILSDHRNWDPESLKRYPNDVTFNEQEVKEVYATYYPSE